MLKKYRAINHIRLITDIDVEGVNGVIEFRGGSIHSRKTGTFSTSNPKLQRAIEKSPQYGKEYILVKQRKNRDTSKARDNDKR